MIFLIPVYLIFLFVWGNLLPSSFKPNLNYRIGSYGHMYTRLKDLNNFDSVDILFLGSSHAYRGFDTRIFEASNIHTFNLGSSSQTPIQTLVLLKRHLHKLNPKCIVFEVNPDTFSSDGVESSVDIIANEKNDINSVLMAFTLNHIVVYNTLIYGLIHDLFSLNKNYKESLIVGADTYISGGYVEKKLSFYSPKPLPTTNFNINQNQLEAFNECLDFISEKKIPVILVYAPIAPSNYCRYINSSEFDKIMGEKTKYYNFNKILTLNDSLHFYDSHHLNQNGVEIFNNKVIELINNDKSSYSLK